MAILITCGFQSYPEEAQGLLTQLSHFVDLVEINQNWNEVSYASVGPHSVAELILKLAYSLCQFQTNPHDRLVSKSEKIQHIRNTSKIADARFPKSFPTCQSSRLQSSKSKGMRFSLPRDEFVTQCFFFSRQI
jgi:hypothetical protein